MAKHLPPPASAAYRVTFGRSRKGAEYLILDGNGISLRVPAPPDLAADGLTRERLLRTFVEQLASTLVDLQRAAVPQ